MWARIGVRVHGLGLDSDGVLRCAKSMVWARVGVRVHGLDLGRVPF